MPIGSNQTVVEYSTSQACLEDSESDLLRKLAAAKSSVSLASLREEAKGWWDATPSTIKTDAVADFTLANSEFLSIANGGSVGLCGPSAFTISAWVNIDDVSQYHEIAACFDSAGSQRAFIFRTQVATGQLHFLIYPSGNGIGGRSITTASGLSPGTTYHVVARYNGSHLQIFVDGTSVASTSYTGAIHQSTSPFGIGFRANGSSYMDGKIGMLGYWSRGLTDSEVTSLYDSGNPVPYADLSTSDKVDLVSFWHLNEPSGVRYDAHGSNNLTDNNTVGVATGPLEYQATEHAAITKWKNQGQGSSAFADLASAAATGSPIVENDLPHWTEGIGLASLTGSLTQPNTVIVVVKDGSGISNYARIIGRQDASGAQQLLSRYGSNYRASAGTDLITISAHDELRKNLAVYFAGSNSVIYRDGVSARSGDSGSSNMTTGFMVGADSGSTSIWGGDIEAVILIDRQLTAQELSILQTL